MAWTTPPTYTTAQIMTASDLNTDLRDNMLETCPATATTAGDIIYADGANSMGSRLALGANRAYLVSDGSDPVWRVGDGMETAAAYTTAVTHTTWRKLGNATYFAYPADVEVTVTTDTRAMVFVRGNLRSDTAGASTYLSYQVSGATTISAAEVDGIRYESSNTNDQCQMGTYNLQTLLTAGSNTFTLMAQMSAGKSTLKGVGIYVMPL